MSEANGGFTQPFRLKGATCIGGVMEDVNHTRPLVCVDSDMLV